MQVMDKVLIPMIRNLHPDNIAAEICSVQPMSGDAAALFKVRSMPRAMYYMASDRSRIETPPKQGAKRHMFGQGWQVYYGTEWIPESVWWKLKVAGL